ncbi:RidA family protein [Pedobacter frigidisoli]|uniref:RidA family protein n=1 Tax=Pedobacter frigidisoli TaxID=2530455 RepID=A0A4R0NCQ8_9SPHI|nr:RidA family protein [Pedobacter frigidisoli]TCC98120.1 RidA family protein [Pedobacter frigidisoli]
MKNLEQKDQDKMQSNGVIKSFDIGVARQMGSFNDGSEVGSGHRWLFTSGMPGMSVNDKLPNNIKEQTELAWHNILSLLKEADMDVENIVKITQYLTKAEDIPEYSMVRKGFMGEVKTASTLLIVAGLGWPDMLVEVEIIAAKRI